jgi:hypothetical protein
MARFRKGSKRRTLEDAVKRIGAMAPNQLDTYRPKTVAERVVLRHYRIATYGTPKESLVATAMLYDRLMGRAAQADADREALMQAPQVLIIPGTTMQEAPNPTLEPRTVEAVVTNGQNGSHEQEPHTPEPFDDPPGAPAAPEVGEDPQGYAD